MSNENWQDIAKKLDGTEHLDPRYQDFDLWEQTLTGHPNEYDFNFDDFDLDGMTNEEVREELDSGLDEFIDDYKDVLSLVNKKDTETAMLDLKDYLKEFGFDLAEYPNQLVSTFLQGIIKELMKKLARHNNNVDKLIEIERQRILDELVDEWREIK